MQRHLGEDVAHAVAGGCAARAQHAQQAQHLCTHRSRSYAQATSPAMQGPQGHKAAQQKQGWGTPATLVRWEIPTNKYAAAPSVSLSSADWSQELSVSGWGYM